MGISASEVSSQLRATSTDVGGGGGDLGGQEYSIRALGGAETIADLAATSLAISGGRTIRLEELGQVIDGSEEPESYATFDGQTVVAFGVYRATGASDTSVAEAVREKLAEVEIGYLR